MNEEVVVRKATIGDFDGIIEVLKSTKLPDETWKTNTGWVKKALRKSSANEDYMFLAAEHGGKLIGFVSCVIFPSLWEGSNQGLINDLFVREGSQGVGVGSMLLKAVVERAEAAGLSELHVSTDWKNKKAQRFYSKHGFTEKQLLLERHV